MSTPGRDIGMISNELVRVSSSRPISYNHSKEIEGKFSSTRWDRTHQIRGNITKNWRLTDTKSSVIKHDTIIRTSTNHDCVRAPDVAIDLLMVSDTKEHMQITINRLNNRKYKHDDPHRCTPKSPCKCQLLRKDKTGKPKCEAGIHIGAINPFTMEIILPSWHRDMVKQKGLLCNFDRNILRTEEVQSFLKKQKKQIDDAETIFIIGNLFGGDPPGKGKYTPKFELIRGKNETNDLRGALIFDKVSNADPIALIEAGRITASREMIEETDGIITYKNICGKNDLHRPDMELIYDFQQCSPRKQTTKRGMVFGSFVNIDDYVNVDMLNQ